MQAWVELFHRLTLQVRRLPLSLRYALSTALVVGCVWVLDRLGSRVDQLTFLLPIAIVLVGFLAPIMFSRQSGVNLAMGQVEPMRLTLAVLMALFWLGLSGLEAGAQTTRAPSPARSVPVEATTIAKGLEHPWALAFLPDGRMLVTERPGRMRLVTADGHLSPPVANVPAVVARGQGGLLDVALAPDFAQSKHIYFTFSEGRSGSSNGTSLARARLDLAGDGPRLEDVTVIFRQEPAWESTMHFGSRIAIARDGSIFLTLGERYYGREKAQDPATHLGKVVRLNPDGSPFGGNPKVPGWAPEVWSIGHRNPQSAAIHPGTGKLWTVEHGARGGDEVNIPEAGKNYGWPVITYGRDYDGSKIGVGTHKEGMEQPRYYWDPSIAPSGMAFYTAELVPEWKGNLFVGALALTHLNRLVLDGEKVVAEERLLADMHERIRDVRQGPDGALWLLTDSSNGRILRVAPPR